MLPPKINDNSHIMLAGIKVEVVCILNSLTNHGNINTLKSTNNNITGYKKFYYKDLVNMRRSMKVDINNRIGLVQHEKCFFSLYRS